MGKPMMCRPSAHLIEYIENQNIEVADIIKDLPAELPIHSTDDRELNKDNVNSSNLQSNEAVPNVNSQDVSASQPVLTPQPVLSGVAPQTQVVISAPTPQVATPTPRVAATASPVPVVDRLGE